MPTRLIYVMDPMCSWCWGFFPVLEQLAQQAASAGVPLHLVVGGLRQEQMPLRQMERERLLGYWQQVSKVSGQRFAASVRLPEQFVYDTTAACQALVAARTLDNSRLLDLVRAIQQSFYCQAGDVTQPAHLVNLAESVGYSREAFAACYDDPLTAQHTQADFAWVQGLGLSGFPTVLVQRNGQLALLTNGYQPFEPLSELLRRWLERAVED